MMGFKDKISIIIRTMDGHYNNLDTAVFSVHANDYPHKEIVFVYQGFDESYFDKIKNFKNIYPEMDMVFVQNKTKNDERARNMNLGVDASTGKYYMFLDDDDCICQEHISSVIAQIEAEKRAWGYSNTICHYYDGTYLKKTKKRFFDKDYSYFELFNKNFIPIHSFIVNKEKATGLYAQENMIRYEDYSLILKIATNFEPAQTHKYTSIYRFFTKKNSHSKEKLIWQKEEEKMNGVKQELAQSSYLAKTAQTMMSSKTKGYRTLISFSSRWLNINKVKLCIKNKE